MAKAIWSGQLQFGLVSIPVKQVTAVRELDVRFNQLNRTTGHRVRQKRVDEVSGDEVAYEDIVKGYEVAPEKYVTITADELASVDPAKSTIMDIDAFVDPATIDPIHFDKPYYLEPQDAAEGPYSLLLAAMRETGKAAIGRYVSRQKEHVAVIWAHGDTLAMTTMHYADEVVTPEATLVEVDDKSLNMAKTLINNLSVENLDMTQYTDGHREKLLEMIERKAAGEAIEAPEVVRPKADVGNLMAALEASVQAVKDRKTKGTAQVG